MEGESTTDVVVTGTVDTNNGERFPYPDRVDAALYLLMSVGCLGVLNNALVV